MRQPAADPIPIRFEHIVRYPIEWPQLSHFVRFANAKGGSEGRDRYRSGVFIQHSFCARRQRRLQCWKSGQPEACGR